MPVELFSIDRRSKDGLQARCKDCNREYYRRNEESIRENKREHHRNNARELNSKARVRYAVHREEYRARTRKRNADHAVERREYARNYKKSNEQRNIAHYTLKNAVRSGALLREPCWVCGSEKTQGHHEDYSQPLKVWWLCQSCHLRLHERRARRQRQSTPPASE